MPKLGGKDLISPTTEKVGQRALVIGASAILVKAYSVPLNDLKALGIELPPALIDTVLLVLVIYSAYSLTLHWFGDLLSFRLWYRESSIWCEFGTNMKLDKNFIRGSIPLLVKLHALEQNHKWPLCFDELDQETRELFKDYKANADLYGNRLEHAGTRFSVLSVFGHYYVWIQSFVLPLLVLCIATYYLIHHGTFVPPNWS